MSLEWANVARTNQLRLLSGNAGTTPGTHFLGTTDDQPVEIKVNGPRALRLKPNAPGAHNLIGGTPENRVAPDTSGATIAGGYSNNISTNTNYSIIGGGAMTWVASNSFYAAIQWGADNFATNCALVAGRCA